MKRLMITIDFPDCAEGAMAPAIWSFDNAVGAIRHTLGKRTVAPQGNESGPIFTAPGHSSAVPLGEIVGTFAVVDMEDGK